MALEVPKRAISYELLTTDQVRSETRKAITTNCKHIGLNPGCEEFKIINFQD